jgi:N-methylhydantoinase B
MRALTNPHVPTNHGCQRPIKVIAPEGTLVNPTMPTGTYQRMVTDHILVDLIMGALAEAVPEKVMADSCGCIYDFCSARNVETHPGGDVGNRHYWGEIVPGGLGARNGKDGITIMSCHVTNCPLPPVEAQEIESPVLFVERAIQPDTAGPGKFRGGFAQRRKWAILGHDGQFFHTSQKSRIPPQGFFGGKPGKSGKWIINEGTPGERILEEAMGDVIDLKYGDTVTCITPGGGGMGDPLERDPEMVMNDMQNGLISPEKALEDYGVVVGAKAGSLLREPTLETRKSRSATGN